MNVSEFPMASRRLVIVSFVLLSLPALLSAAGRRPGGGQDDAKYPYVAHESLAITSAAEVALRMPTAVAAGPDGSILVADGVHDRVVRFNADGSLASVIESAGSRRLNAPLHVAVDGKGRVWIADTGNRRVVALSPGGELIHEFDLQDAAGEHTVDITGTAPTPDGAAVWAVDNDNHRLIKIDLAGGARTVAGQHGEALGQLQYPFMPAVAADGTVFVSDVVNGRVAAFTSDGRPTGRIGTYGVEAGDLYRPKGVAIDGAGDVWVSDSVLGVVQVFTQMGRFLDVVRDVDGRPMRFDGPAGIAFDAAGNLYVSEVAADRVRRLRIERGPRPTPGAESARWAEISGRQAQSCTICHIDWMPAYADDLGDPLVALPPPQPQQPLVSQSPICLSCHDGSVVDSRERVWDRHGHRTGVVPPPTMNVPAFLPLVEGQVACRTCHSAHTTGPPTGNIAEAVFLRVPNQASELCIACHADKTRGPELGTHPTGGMPWPVPHELVEAGAKVGPNPRELTCQVCHTPHGSSYDHLLVMGVESNQLCLSCHDQMRPGMFREGDHTEHPLSPLVNAEQKAAIQRLDTRLGPGDHLICLSCHKLHHGKGQRFMLAAELTDGQMCLSCHSNKNSVVGTQHDLRTNFPEERNRLGMTAQTGGPCSACHMFHRYARPPEFAESDPAGHCVTCHQPGRIAAGSLPGDSLHHGQVRCEQCHNPHTQGPVGGFLPGRPVEVCSECHAEQAKLAGGAHDYLAHPDAAWPQASRAAADACLSCHRPHADPSAGFFRVQPVADVQGVDAVCTACHREAAWGGSAAVTALHPQRGEPLKNAHGLPLTDEGDSGARIGCNTCHDPHAQASHLGKLLRTAEGQPAASLCLNCHVDMKHVPFTGHAPESLARAGFDAAACGPCHQMHGAPDSVLPDRLWPTALLASSMVNEGGAMAERGDATNRPSPGRQAGHHAGQARAMKPVGDALCTACHRAGGPAPAPAVATHPVVPFMQVASDAGPLPLFDAEGRPSAQGEIACRTCHSPHGQSPEEAGLSQEAIAGMTQAEQRALRLQLRPFQTPNTCTSCHGGDALRRFLYFHDPQRRGGELDDPARNRGVLGSR